MKDKYLLLTNSNNGYFDLQSNKCMIRLLYKSNRYFERILRKIVLKITNTDMCSLLFSHWMPSADKAETIILFDTGNCREVIRFLREKYKEKRIILYYWNPVSRSVYSDELASYCELWSFDERDCQMYEMRYNPQFYLNEYAKYDMAGKKIVRDVFYVGVDKRRGDTIQLLKREFEKHNVSYLFHIVRSGRKEDRSLLKEEYSPQLEYSDVVEHIKESRAIVDIVSENQSGMTLRPLEAVFFQKKLITNDKRIRDTDLYRAANVFVIGEDSWDRLSDIVYLPYDYSGYEELSHKYSLKGWLERFDNVKRERQKGKTGSDI